jgi:hypothetical protein
MQDYNWAVIAFFNIARTDFVIYGPFKTYEAANIVRDVLVANRPTATCVEFHRMVTPEVTATCYGRVR